MSSLCTALDLLQNGGITSGNDVFFVVFWTLHGNAKYLVMMFMDKKVKRCFRNSLAACAAFASEFGRLWCNFIFSWMCMSFVNNNKPIYFSAKLRFAFFWKLHDVFGEVCERGERFWSLKLFENVLEMVMNSTNMNSSM